MLLAVASPIAAAAGSEALVEVETRNVELVARRSRQAKDLFEAGETTRVAAEERLVSAREHLQEALGRRAVSEEVHVALAYSIFDDWSTKRPLRGLFGRILRRRTA